MCAPCVVGNGPTNIDIGHRRSSRSKIRKFAHWTQILVANVDAMVNALFPLLDLYGDALEGLDLSMVQSKEPSAAHVTVSHQIQQRLANILRQCWDIRKLLRKILQDEHGCLPDNGDTLDSHVQKTLTAAIESTTEASSICDAWQARCRAVDQFYERHLDKRMNDALFVLTVSSVIVLPLQLMSGLYGQNTSNYNSSPMFFSNSLNI